MQKSKLALSLTALLLLATALPSEAGWAPEHWVRAVPYGNDVQLLNDTAFNNGFRAFMSCKQFEGINDGLGYTGNCVDYHTPYVNTQGRNYVIRTWPDSGAPNDANKFWHFNEGIHSGFSAYGYNFPQANPFPAGATDLAVHRLEANRENSNGGGLIAESPNLIWLQSMNNLSTSDPHYGGLVRTISSDRHGFLMMYMNTGNEIRNSPSANAYDTWPTFGVEQNFKKVIDLATLSEVHVSTNVSIPFVQTHYGFPGGHLNATYSIGFTLRKKAPGSPVLYLGYILYSYIGENERFIGDQWGQAVYNGNNADLGGPIVPGAPPRTITFELRSLMNKAIAYAQQHSPGALDNVTLDDYYLAAVGFGWETMGGYHEVKSEISNVSLIGRPRTQFDSEVYQESTDPNQPSTYKAWNNPTWLYPNDPDNYTEGQMRAHWVKWGLSYGLVASTTFDVKIYMDRFGAYMPQCYDGNGARNYPCAADHYVRYGRSWGFVGHW
jgi:hypothetical protein